jgi:hypothetical protein
MTQQEILAVGREALAEARRLWSVTTLIKTGLGNGDALMGWVGKVVAQRAYDKPNILQGFRDEDDRMGAIKWLQEARWEKSGKAMARGTDVHKIVEAYAYGKQPVYPSEEVAEAYSPYETQVLRFLDEHQPTFLAAEAPVYNLRYSYAGTMDLILELDGVRCIVDAKTTDKDPNDPEVRSLPPYAEVALQLVAYARAEMVGVSPAVMRTVNRRRYYVYDPDLGYEPMPEVQGALALVIAPTFYRLVPVAIDDEVWRCFGYVREAARWQLEVARRVLGPDITPPPREKKEEE